MLLIDAVRNSRVSQVRLLLKAGVELDKTDEHGKTALIHSCFLKEDKARMNILKLLVCQGANLSKQDKQQKNVFSWACRLGREDVLSFLLESPRADKLKINVTDQDGNNPLILAVMSENPKVVEIVLNVMKSSCLTWEFKQNNNAGICPLVQAFIQGDKKCAAVLMKESNATISDIVQYIKKLLFELGDVSNEEFYSIDRVILKALNDNQMQTRHERLNDESLLELLFENREKILALETKKPGVQLAVNKQVGSSTPKRTETSYITEEILPKSQWRNSKSKVSRSLSAGGSDKFSPCCATNDRACLRSSLSNLENMSSSRLNFKKIMELYAEQSSSSFRQGQVLIASKGKTPSPPTPLSYWCKNPSVSSAGDSFLAASRRSSCGVAKHDAFSESTLDKQLRRQHSRGVRSASITVAALTRNNLYESALDKQIREKYSRESRSSSVHVLKLPFLF